MPFRSSPPYPRPPNSQSQTVACMLHTMSRPSPSPMLAREINRHKNSSSSTNGISCNFHSSGTQVRQVHAGKLDLQAHKFSVSIPDLKKQLPRRHLNMLDFAQESNMKESGHMCRYCKRRFSSGRALGGHMRSHTAQFVAHESTHLKDDVMHSARSVDNHTRSLPSADSHMQSSAWNRSDFHRYESSKIRNMEDLATTEEEDAMSARESSSSEANNDTEELPNNKVEDTVHSLYALRRNPKRSRLFSDQEFAFDSTVKRASSSSPERSRACNQCGKEFPSSRALFGHMRCHPEREWKGTQYLETSEMQDKEDSSAGAVGQRKPDLVAHNSGFELESELENKDFGEPEASYTGIDVHGMGIKRNRLFYKDVGEEETSNEREEAEVSNSRRKLSSSRRDLGALNRKEGKYSDSISDLGSSERVYTHTWSEHQFHPKVTGKRSKRSRHTCKPLRILTYPEPELDVVTTPTEIKEERDMADCLVMLANAGRSLEEAARTQRQLTEESAFSDSARNQVSEQRSEGTEDYSEEQETTWVGKSTKGIQRYGKDKKVDEAGFYEDGLKRGQVSDLRQKGNGDNLTKYECNTCKRIFNSHQALGGHRASHRRVKGCFAKTNTGEESHESVGEDITNEENLKLEDDLQKGPYSLHGQEGERSYSMQLGDDQQTMAVTTAARKFKGHECTICHRVFASGQALGGHKRCHWTGEKTTEATSVASSNKQVSSINGIQNRVLKEDFLDLNLPAPLDDDDMEAAYGMAEVVPVYSSLLDAKRAEETMQDLKSKGAEREHDNETTLGDEDGTEEMHLRKPMAVSVDRKLQNNGESDESLKCGTSSQVQLNLSSRFVHCNICDIIFTSLEAFSNHQKTHASLVSSVAGITPISA